MKLLWLIPLVVMTGGGLFGTIWFRGAAEKPQPRRSAVRDAGRVAANGVVEGARPEVTLRPEAGGNIAAIYFRENQTVKPGDLLIELNNESQRNQVELAKADVAVARAEYGESKSRSDRSHALGTMVVSREAYEADHFKTQKAAAEVEKAEARLRLAQADLAKTRLTSPIKGRILRVYAEPGEQAGPTTAQPVLLLADDSRRRVRAFIEELDAHRVRVGQRAEVVYDGQPDRRFAGTVTEVLPRMGKRALQTDAPEEYKDIYFREVMIDLEAGAELALNLRVKVFIRDEEEPR
jgi:RND family efflux transporter MFP subunit